MLGKLQVALRRQANQEGNNVLCNLLLPERQMEPFDVTGHTEDAPIRDPKIVSKTFLDVWVTGT